MSGRIGIGYDSHRFGGSGPLILGGIEIPHELGLDGHSDADVVTHALTDAVLGACGEGDIGRWFPPEDDRWRDADSIELLTTVVEKLSPRVANADLTVICEQPKLGPHREKIEARLREVVGAPVTLKATTNEGMGAIGRGEGIAAIAVCLLDH